MINILIANSDTYLSKRLVMFESLYESCLKENICVYIIHGRELSNQGLAILTSKLESLSLKFYEINVSDEYFKILSKITYKEGMEPSFYKLVAIDILPYSIDRFLWLDADTLVIGDITDFYYQDFENNYFVASQDMAFGKGKNQFILGRRGEERVVYNAGVLLVNRKKIKEEIKLDDMWQWAELNKKALMYFDQDIVNGFFLDKIKLQKGWKYNCQSGSMHYTKEKELLREAKIIHFTGKRPWDIDYRWHYSSAISGEIWWKYARKCGMLKEYFKWKVRNVLKVGPWIVAYRLGKLLHVK